MSESRLERITRDVTKADRGLTTFHHFTVDVEEYFQVSAFESHVDRADWGRYESRVAKSVTTLLELLERHDARATFFVLGWLADKQPALVQEITRAGHEVASHGWDHRRVYLQKPEEFRDSVRRTKRLLEHLSGQAVAGFRAPSFSIVPGCEWALEVLVDEGYCYDSSLFPVRRPGYGYSDGQRDPHWLHLRNGRLAELPPATLRVFGVNLPSAGGAYFRFLPYPIVRATLSDYASRGVPATFYIHPWEVDPDQPRLRAPWFTRLRHYWGLRDTRHRLSRLLSEFRFTALRDTVDSL